MSNKKLSVLFVLAAATLSAAIYISRESEKYPAGNKTMAPGSYIIQGLDTSAITSIEVGRSANPARLVKKGNSFVISNKENYPANTSKINRLIRSVLDIKTSEFYTSDPNNYETLRLEEHNAQNIIKFYGKDNKLLTGIIIGSAKFFGEQMETRLSYVRAAGSNDVYLADDVPFAPSSAVDFADKQILSLESDSLKEVSIKTAESSYTLKQEGNNISISALPEGKILKERQARQIFNSAVNISFSDVDRETVEGPDIKFDNELTCRTDNQILYKLQLGSENDKFYLKCSAEHLDQAPVIKERRVESDEELREKEQKLISREKVEHFNQLHSGWIYQLPNWKAKDMIKGKSELLEEPETEQDSQADVPSVQQEETP